MLKQITQQFTKTNNEKASGFRLVKSTIVKHKHDEKENRGSSSFGAMIESMNFAAFTKNVSPKSETKISEKVIRRRAKGV